MWIYIFSSLGCVSRNGIARSCGNSHFSFLRNLKGILQSSYVKVIHPPALVTVLIFDPSKCDMVSHYAFDLYFPDG